MDRLRATLRQIDGRGYPSYKDIKGRYRFERFELEVVHVQGDPFAAPSRIAARVPRGEVGWLTELGADVRERRPGVEDALLRSVCAVLERRGERRGSGRSGQWGVARPGQEMLPRTACEVDTRFVTLRLTAGLPAEGRRVLGRAAWGMLGEELPEVVAEAVLGADRAMVRAHAAAYEDQETLRLEVVRRGWVGFIADGAVLPRRSGVDDRPMEGGAVAWVSPPELRQEVALPNAGVVVGSAIPPGVTLICGGGFHGKSTLLRTLERAVYNHVPGDGRERCATRGDAAHVRAEDGRAVAGVDISAFIGELPDGRATTAFSTANASGSTSQAANIVEALELGARALLIDEDTSAANFMVRDRRMQELIAAEDEPITPFVDRVRGLHEGLKVSSVLVVGGAGDYLDVADTVIVLNRYVPSVQTGRAKAIAASFPSQRRDEARVALGPPPVRVPEPGSLDPGTGRDRVRSRANRTDAITFGEEEIDISALAQFVDPGQARMAADLLLSASRELVDGHRGLREICGAFLRRLVDDPLSALGAHGYGDRVYCRPLELGATINRLRTLRVRARREH